MCSLISDDSMGTSRAFGWPCQEMVISSPVDALATNAENCALPSRTETTVADLSG